MATPPKADKGSRLPTSNNLDPEIASKLLNRAAEMRSYAFAPYSGYQVGAAILSASGEIFGGCNVENRSYGATICAERAAISVMVSAGQGEIIAIAVDTGDSGFPCGICLQTISEFVPDPKSCTIVVPTFSSDGQSAGWVEKSLYELAPNLWKSSAVQPKT